MMFAVAAMLLGGAHAALYTAGAVGGGGSHYLSCDIKCDLLKDECIVEKCNSFDVTCLDGCAKDYDLCTKVCKAALDTCAAEKIQCKVGCDPLAGAFRTTCNNKCTVKFQCCSLPKAGDLQRAKEWAVMPTHVDIQTVHEANSAFSLASLGSSFFEQRNVNFANLAKAAVGTEGGEDGQQTDLGPHDTLCTETCDNQYGLCRNKCLLNRMSPANCVAQCDAAQNDCRAVCAAKTKTCNFDRNICHQACPQNGSYQSRCFNLCNAEFECCEIGYPGALTTRA